MSTITPASWIVDDGSDIAEFVATNVWTKRSSDTLGDQSVYFTKSTKSLTDEPKDEPVERLIICAFYDRVV